MPPLHYLCEWALPMISDLLFYKLLLVGLLWLCILLHVVWPSERAASCPITPTPTLPRRQRSKGPRNPLLASSTSRCVTSAEAPPLAVHRLPPPHRHCSCSPEDAAALSTRNSSSVPIRSALIMAGRAGATSALTVTPGANRGGSSSVCRATAISSRRTGRSSMVSGYHPTCSYGLWAPWRKA